MTSAEEGQSPSNEPEEWQDTHPLSPLRWGTTLFTREGGNFCELLPNLANNDHNFEFKTYPGVFRMRLRLSQPILAGVGAGAELDMTFKIGECLCLHFSSNMA